MKQETIDALKIETEYTTEPAHKCANCKHSDEVECSHVDRMFNLFCNVHTVGSFKVKPEARCRLFEPR